MDTWKNIYAQYFFDLNLDNNLRYKIISFNILFSLLGFNLVHLFTEKKLVKLFTKFMHFVHKSHYVLIRTTNAWSKNAAGS